MATISPKNIAEAIYEATKGKSGNDLALVIKRSAKMLKEKRMLGKSEDVFHVLEDVIDKRTGTVRVKVTTAKILDSIGRKKIENETKEKYRAQIVIGEFFEEAELLGGMRVEVNDEVTDTTYKSRLHELENFLIQQK